MIEFAIGMAAVATAAWIRVALAMWRSDRHSDLPAPRIGHILGGPRLQRGMARGAVVGACLLVSTLLVAIAGALTQSSASQAVGTVGVVGVLLCLVLYASVILVARPKWIIPPHMRSDVGLINLPTRCGQQRGVK